MTYTASQSMDPQLLTRYREGDETAFRELVNQYKNTLYTFLRRFFIRHDLVEDVFQETLLQVYASRASYDNSRPLQPWLLTIAANKAKDAMRIAKRHQAIPVSDLVYGNGLSIENVLNTFASYDADPSTQLEQAETVALIRNVVASLPRNQCEILTLAYFMQLRHKQIADALDIPIGTVKSRLHTAITRFSKKWKETCEHSQTREESGLLY
ncbi:RNA polymerase sigma factor [Planctomycetota bacterium]